MRRSRAAFACRRYGAAKRPNKVARGQARERAAPGSIRKIARPNGPYILNQEKHHRRQSFQDEYLELLKMSEIEYDEQYVW